MKNKIEIDYSFGKRVAALIEQNNMKASDFYNGAGVPQQSFYDWKNKGMVPGAMIALRVARFFGVPLEWLLAGEIWERPSDKNPVNPLQKRVDELQQKIDEIKRFVKNA